MSIKARNGWLHYRFMFQGREYSVSTGLEDTRQGRINAQQQESDHRKALREGRSPEHRITVRQFSDAAADFLTWARDVEYRQHPASARRLSVSMTSAKQFFDRTPVSAIDAGQIENYKAWRLAEHRVRDITLRHDLHSLSRFFKYAITQHWTNRNPIADVSIPSDADSVRMHILTAKEETEYFTRAARHKDLHDIGRLILNQAMRPDEVTTLAKDDVDLERGQLHIRKGKTKAARRTLDLTAESKRILARRMASAGPWVFPSKRNPGEPIARVNNAHDKILAEAKKAGTVLNFVLYDFRHTWATRAAQCGIDLATIAAILGHSGLRVVQKYIHPTAQHKKAAMLTYEQAHQQTATGRPN